MLAGILSVWHSRTKWLWNALRFRDGAETEDTTGKGHRARVTSAGDWLIALVWLAGSA